MIRAATEADLPRMLEIYAPYILHTTVSFEYTVPTAEEFLERFRGITAQFPWLVWQDEEGTVQGYAYASAPFSRAAYRWCAEPSIYLAPQARGKGIGAELYRVLEEILRRQGYRVLYALIASENTDSLHFHAKMGYHFVMELPRCGYKFDHWIGLTWMEKRSKIVENPNNVPKPWRNVVQNTKNLSDILDNLSLF